MTISRHGLRTSTRENEDGRPDHQVDRAAIEIGGFADTAYTGTGLCVPYRKPKGHTLTESAREFNRRIASHRASIERVIAHVKNWKILATGYRALLDRFPVFLDAVTKLELYRIS